MSLNDFLPGSFEMEPGETWTLWDGKEITVQHTEPTDKQKLTCLGIWDRYLTHREVRALKNNSTTLTPEELLVVFGDGKGLEYPEFR